MKQKNQWKKIKDFPMYEASTSGMIRSVRQTKNGIKKLVLSPRARGGSKEKPYLAVDLYKNGEAHTKYVHRLVLITFKGDKSKRGLEVDHKDRNPKNNNLSNLRWVTHSENLKNTIKRKSTSKAK